MNRRGFLTGMAGLLAAPAIVRVSSIMPVSAWPVANARCSQLIREPFVGDVIVTGWDAYGNTVVEFINMVEPSKTRFRDIAGIRVVVSTDPLTFSAYPQER